MEGDMRRLAIAIVFILMAGNAKATGCGATNAVCVGGSKAGHHCQVNADRPDNPNSGPAAYCPAALPNCLQCTLPDCAPNAASCPTGRCQLLRYGLGSDYTDVVDPIDDLFKHSSFTGTYTYSKGETQNPGCDD